MKHLSKKHQNEVNESNIDPLPTNNLIEKWVNKVLEVQGKLLKKEDDPVASQDEEDREQVTEVVVSTITDAKQLMDDALKRYKCTHCVYKYVLTFFSYLFVFCLCVKFPLQNKISVRFT